MTNKTAYLWGPVSSFSGQLAAFLVQKGWHVHVATKSAFHIALSPLDLRSTAQDAIVKALGGMEKYKIFDDRFRFLDVNEISKSTKYDAFIFCGLPPNFDEARVSRAPWAADNFFQIVRKFKGVPVFIASSLWSAVQKDGVVPEEIECERRKPHSQFEAVCQQYETRLLKTLGTDDTKWYLVRLPMISGSTADGRMLNFTGPSSLFQRLSLQTPPTTTKQKSSALNLQFNPDATMWFLPVDVAVTYFWRLLEDDQRPRICNLVSTQATLNQEWLQHLAKALGFGKAAQVEHDTLSLTSVVRKMLADNVLVKTRGLFEVMGRYQQVPTVLDSAYFRKVIEYGRKENWGDLASPAKLQAAVKPISTFSSETAKSYLTEFLPRNIDNGFAKEIGGEQASIGFKVDDTEDLDFVLTSENGQFTVRPFQADEKEPAVKFHFTIDGLEKLVQRKVSLERAIVQKQAKVEGPPLEILRACNFLKKFMKSHPYKESNGTSLSKEAAPTTK